MKSFKNIILSVLLFTFAFFIMHDYVIVKADTQIVCELAGSEANTSAPSENCGFNVASQVHECIHVLLATHLNEPLPLIAILPEINQFDTQIGLISHINLVPQRPPLS
ncbi:hypothetical protein KKG72_06475 [bacterium]|nr:hypothetical protein [bacterium]MBU1993313.1 hypothetical protein [bacterium]